jgi:hypothetical protein
MATSLLSSNGALNLLLAVPSRFKPLAGARSTHFMAVHGTLLKTTLGNHDLALEFIYDHRVLGVRYLSLQSEARALLAQRATAR